MAIEVGGTDPDVTLSDPEGERVTPPPFRGRRSVVLVVSPAPFGDICTARLSRTGEQEGCVAGGDA